MKSRIVQTQNIDLAGLQQIDSGVLERLFEHTPDVAFFIKDAEGRYVHVNQSLLQRHGFKTKAACRILLETDESVAAIAQQCGFWDHSAFTRTFRSVTGVTPTAFRKDSK
jgi:AraC-like DNA-binding protein